MMEYVVVAVLIAAACLIAIVVFNRGIMRDADVAMKGIVGRGVRAGEAEGIYRADAKVDMCEAEKFPGKFSDAGK